MPPTGCWQTRHAAIFETLQREISEGRFAATGQLPGEIEPTRRFRISRPSVARALDGLRRGKAASAGLLGLIGAGIDRTEILGPIGAELARSAQDAGHRLILGGSGRSERDAERLTSEFLARGVAGVFLAPLEVARQRELINRRLVGLLR